MSLGLVVRVIFAVLAVVCFVIALYFILKYREQKSGLTILKIIIPIILTVGFLISAVFYSDSHWVNPVTLLLMAVSNLLGVIANTFFGKKTLSPKKKRWF